MSLSQKLVEHGCNIIFVNTEFIHKRVVSSMVNQEGINSSPIKLVSIPDGLGLENDRSDLVELYDSILNTMPYMLEKLIEDIHLSGDHRISCIVVDGITAWALEVGCKMGIKGAVFWPALAGIFALQCNIPKLNDDGIIDSDDRRYSMIADVEEKGLLPLSSIVEHQPTLDCYPFFIFMF